MRKVILSIALLLASGVFTSCTDTSEDNIQEKEKFEIQNTGGEEDQDPPKDPDSKEGFTKGRTESFDTGGEDEQDPIEDPDLKEVKSRITENIDTGGEEDPTPVEDDED